MAEEKGEGKAKGKGKGKKKGGKLPLILVAVLVVAGGGFFAMSKGKKPEKPKEPKIELGSVESLGDEFLVNLGDPRTFLTCKVSVQLRKVDKDIKDDHVSIADPAEGEGGHGGGKDSTYSIARDAVISVLSSKTINDVTNPDFMKHLKREIAFAINQATHVEEHADGKDGEAAADGKDSAEGKDAKEAKDGHASDNGHSTDAGLEEAKIDDKKLDELGFDSEKGPVLKVLITDFAYQKY